MVDPTMSLQDFMRLRHAELAVYIVTLRPNAAGPERDPDSAEGQELLRQHFLYWWALEESRNLLGAGPVNAGAPDVFGMALLLAPSLEDATRMAQDEPFHKAGWRINTVQRWNLNEGLAVDFVKGLEA